METTQDNRKNLAAEPEADEPVAWMHPNGGVIQTRLTGLDRDTYTIPLYTRFEPARKPMTEEEIQKGVKRLKEMVGNKSSEVYAAFEVGIRVAEKYHGIGRGME
jgi:hypothetical protein